MWAEVPVHRRPNPVIAAAIGGVIGASLRWLSALPFDFERGDFPWIVLFVNLVGSLAIGAAAMRVPRGSLQWAFIVTGVLGGFTTMSGFALAFNDLVDAGRTAAAFTYLGVTMAGGVTAVLLGERGAR